MKNEKSRKPVLKVLLVTAAVIALTAQSAFAFSKDKDFTKANVDSNTFNAVSGTTTTKNSSNTPQVKLENIYKANGDDSNYKIVLFKVNSGNKQATSKSSMPVEKGTLENLILTSAYKKEGVSLTLHAMGNDPALDCQITGNFNPA